MQVRAFEICIPLNCISFLCRLRSKDDAGVMTPEALSSAAPSSAALHFWFLIDNS